MQNFLKEKKPFILTIAALLLIWEFTSRDRFIQLIPFLVICPLILVVIYLLWGWILNKKNPSNLTSHKILMEFPAAYFAAAVLLFSFISPLENSSNPLYKLGSFILLSSIVIASISLFWMYSKGIYILIKYYSDSTRNKYGQDLFSHALSNTVAILLIMVLFGILLTPKYG